MNDGHERANRRDKGNKPRYWEQWVEGGSRPSSGTREAAIFNHVYNTRRPLKLTDKWSVERLLDRKLMTHCSLKAGQFMRTATVEKTLSVSTIKTTLKIRRTIGSEIEEIMLLIDRSARELRKLTFESLNTSSSDEVSDHEVAEAINKAKRYLSGLFNLDSLLATGVFPVDFMESEVAKEPRSSAMLRLVTHYLYLRSAVDLFYQRPYAPRNGFGL